MSTSQKKAAASRSNGSKGRGPTTSAGKQKSSKNALTHGLLSREIQLAGNERSEFELLRNLLMQELQPSTGVLCFMFDEILVNMWKSKLVERLVHRELQRSIEEPPEKTSSNEPDEAVDPVYSDSAHRLGRKLQLLRDLRSEIQPSGYISDRWEQLIIEAFGVWFYAALTEWKPANPVVLQMVESILRKSETFQLTLPEQPTAEEIERINESQKALEDPLRRQFIAKLFELEKAHLEQLLALEGRSGGHDRQSDPLDRFLRYQTTIKRDLYRAIAKYLELKSAS